MTNSKKSWKFTDFLIIATLVALMSFVAKLKDDDKERFPWLLPGDRTQLGAEYNTIAKSIRSGEGFSHPFNVKSGPTAWMPPVLPYLLATLYTITSDNTSVVVEIMVVIQGIVLISSGLLVVKLACELGIRWFAHAIFFVMLCESYQELFQRTGDFWLNLFGLNVLYYFCTYKWELVTKSARSVLVWGVTGGVLALFNPIVGFCWAAITTALFLRAQRVLGVESLRPLKLLVLAATCSFIVIMPWTVRNRLALGKWVPVKSNAAYEIWQSQILDNDGVLDSKSAWIHPWGYDGEQRAEYLRVGEIEFVSSRWPPVRDSLLNNPGEYLLRVANRMSAALLYYEPILEDYEKLKWPMAFKRIVFPLPLVGIFLIFVFGSIPMPRPLVIAMLLFATYLGTYILISYYDRYAAPLLTIKSCLIVGGAWALLRIRPPKATSEISVA